MIQLRFFLQAHKQIKDQKARQSRIAAVFNGKLLSYFYKKKTEHIEQLKVLANLFIHKFKSMGVDEDVDAGFGVNYCPGTDGLCRIALVRHL